MKRGVGVRRLLLLLGLLLAAVVARVGCEAGRVASLPSPAAAKQRKIRGAFHVHSTASDGLASVERIAGDAAAAGLDFVVMTDHNLLPVPAPRREQGVLIVFAQELSTPWGHLVSLGTSRGLDPEERSQAPIERVRSLGGLSVLAHPVQRRNPWRDAEAGRHADGLELYSGDSFWREALEPPWGNLLPALGAFLVRPEWGLLTLSQPVPDVREQLLRMTPAASLLALCALDAHGWPSYRAAFRTWATFLPRTALADTPEQAAAEVLGDLREGRSWCGVPAIAPPDDLKIDRGGSRGLRVGDVARLELPAHPGWESRVEVSGPAVLKDESLVPTGPGWVLMEVWARPTTLWGGRWYPWLVASPVRVGAESKP